MENITFHLDNFDGPLDLLLHLISKNKVSIYDIPICKILEQYIDILNKAKNMNLEVTSEFISVAAQLILIKSKMLLPKQNQETEENEDPRAQLTLMLLEYQQIKIATKFLAEKAKNIDDTFVKSPENISKNEEYKHNVNDLIHAAKYLLKRTEIKLPPPVKSFYGIVGKEIVPVSKMVDKIIDIFSKKNNILFSELFENLKNRSEIVATFLAVLEISKTHKINIYNENENTFISMIYDEEGAN